MLIAKVASAIINQVHDLLRNLNIHKPVGPDEMHPRVLKDLADVIAKQVSITFQRPWQSGKVPCGWRKGNIVPIFKKEKQEVPGNYQPVSFTSVPGKIMEQLLLEVMLRPIEENEVM